MARVALLVRRGGEAAREALPAAGGAQGLHLPAAAAGALLQRPADDTDVLPAELLLLAAGEVAARLVGRRQAGRRPAARHRRAGRGREAAPHPALLHTGREPARRPAADVRRHHLGEGAARAPQPRRVPARHRRLRHVPRAARPQEGTPAARRAHPRHDDRAAVARAVQPQPARRPTGARARHTRGAGSDLRAAVDGRGPSRRSPPAGAAQHVRACHVRLVGRTARTGRAHNARRTHAARVRIRVALTQ